MTLKPIREVFADKFWRELQASHKVAQDRVVQVNAVTAQQDAVVLHLSTRKENKQDETKK